MKRKKKGKKKSPTIVCEKAKEIFPVVDEIYYGYVFPDGTAITVPSHTEIVEAYKPSAWVKEKDGKKKYESLAKYENIYGYMEDFSHTCDCVLVHSVAVGEGKDIHKKSELAKNDRIDLYVTAIKEPTQEQIKTITPTLKDAMELNAYRKFNVTDRSVCDYEKLNPRPWALQGFKKECW